MSKFILNISNHCLTILNSNTIITFMYTVSQLILNESVVVFSHEEEKEISQYLFNTLQYQCQDMQYITEKNNKRLSFNEINLLIEKYYPQETQKINSDISYEKTFLGKNLVKFGIIADWYYNYFEFVYDRPIVNKPKLM